MNFFTDVLSEMGSVAAQEWYMATVQIACLLLFLFLMKKLSKIEHRVKNLFSGFFTMSEIRKDSRIKRACIENTTLLKCRNTMLFRLHNGESAGDFYHYQKSSAIFDEPRQGAKLLLPEWQNISYSIFAARVDKIFEHDCVYGHVLDIEEDNSYQVFHTSKGIYYEVLKAVYIDTGYTKRPFGYLAAFFNMEQAEFFSENPEAVQTYFDQMDILRAKVEFILKEKMDSKPTGILGRCLGSGFSN